MAVHSFKAVQRIPAPLPQVWDFFSSHANLQAITPADMHFKIISRYHGDAIYAGQIIEYTIKPILGIPLYWMTEITHVEEKKFFVDEQRKGPYRFWHHQHFFSEIPGGVEMTDIVHYKNPLRIIGDMVNSVYMKRKLKAIFDFRYRKIGELFGEWKEPGL